MKRSLILVLAFVCLGGWLCPRSLGEQHRATRLGNPETRFAPPLTTAEEFRSRFRDPRLKADIAEILRQWGWKGQLDDLFRASQAAEVRDVKISVGAVMPFMSSRENGRPICLRNVLWAGKEPAPAYVFNFSSNGQSYRCVMPKACSNFYLDDLGPEPVPGLAIACNIPEQIFPGKPVQVCFTVQNPKTGWVRNGTVRFPVPQNCTVISTSPGGLVSTGEVQWQFATLAPKASLKFCAQVSAPNPGTVTFTASVNATNAPASETTCGLNVVGIPAILLDAVDLEDPVQVGSEVTYEVKVTNQGSAEATNVRLVFVLPPNEEFVSGGGATPVERRESGIQTDPLAMLAPKGEAVWRVVVKALEPGDVRFKMDLSSDQFTRPIHEEESTHLY